LSDPNATGERDHSTDQRLIRVFVSSTFRDMHAERDHLVTVVFPELRERIEQLGMTFFDIDLRWGVPGKDVNGETANSWEYCKQWIERVEPFFVCVLGQRYGWVPDPEQFKDADEVRQQHLENRSITDMEVRYAVLQTRLKRRSFFYLRATAAPDASTDFVDPPPLLQKVERLKHEVRACGRPVREYRCSWTGSGFAGMEEFGCQVLEDLWSGVLRDDRYVSREVWRQVLGAEPDGNLYYTDESRPVPRELWEKLVALAKPEPTNPLDYEREQMAAFSLTRRRWFHGRTKELQELLAFANGSAADGPRLAVVEAAPGQGKSALLATLWARIPQPTQVIAHFIGATEGSASAQAIVRRLLSEIERCGLVPATEKDAEEARSDFTGQVLQLSRRLQSYGGSRRIVILLDGLNQLSDGHDLRWLPINLGPGVRVIVSCVRDAADAAAERVFETLTSLHPAPLRIVLQPLADRDVRDIIVAYLREYCHELDREHLDALVALRQAHNPLYLLVMLHELRTLSGNDLNQIVPARITTMARDHPDSVSLFDWVLQHLEEAFGAEPVRWWCSCLALGREGMGSGELADLLARRFGAEAAANAYRIERGLRRYLQHRGPQLDWFHRELRRAVLGRYCPPTEIPKVHCEIALYFLERADPGRRRAWEGNEVRPLAELCRHLADSGALLADLLDVTISDPLFWQARCRLGGPVQLRGDCTYVLQRRFSPAVAAVEQSVTSGLSALLQRPNLCIQTIANRLAWLEVEEKHIGEGVARAQQVLDAGPWIKTDSAYPSEVLTSQIVYQTDAVAACLSSDEKRLVVLGSGGKIRVIELNDGSSRTLPGTPSTKSEVKAICLVDSDSRLAWLDSDSGIHVEHCEFTFRARDGETLMHHLPPLGVAVAKADQELVAWDPKTNSITVLATEIPSPVTALRSSRNGHLLCTAGRVASRLTVLSTAIGVETLLDMAWNDAPIVDADLSPDGETILVLCRDRSLRRLRARDGAALCEPFHYERSKSVALLGAPFRCALGSGAAAAWSFLATYDGHIGALNWETGELRRLPDWNGALPRRSGIFAYLHDSQRCAIEMADELRLLTESSRTSSQQFHRFPVSFCVVADTGDIVSASKYESTVCWFDKEPGLRIRARQNHPGISAMAPVPGSSDVLLGNNTGFLWRQTPNDGREQAKLPSTFSQGIAALACRSNQSIVAADATGCIAQYERGVSEPRLLRYGSDTIRQIAILPADDTVGCWSLHERSERGDPTFCLSLTEGIGRENELLRDRYKMLSFTVAPETDLLCTSGPFVQVMRTRKNRKPATLFRRDTAARLVAFVARDRYLAVIGDDSWLEIWNLSPNLPTITAVDLPADATCLAVSGCFMLVGFLSGQLLRLRLCGRDM
jgi:hypothetical protein